MLRFDPFRDLERINQENRRRSSQTVLAFDAIRDEDEVVIYFDVPGITAEDLDVSVERNELTVTAIRRWEEDDRQILATERPQGVFSRRLMVSDAVDTEGLRADLRDGVLIISIPVAERSRPRRVDVQVGSSEASPIDVRDEEPVDTD